jgi:hypothetical protein
MGRELDLHDDHGQETERVAQQREEGDGGKQD